MMKFNDELFDELKKLTYKPAIIPAPNDLESVLRVCEQRSDRSRRDAFNSNCIVDGIPFSWEYTSYNAVVDPEDSSNNLDITYRVISFPMLKRTTGWRFFLDVEENGGIYLSEGKGTLRTRVSLRILNDLHWAQRKIIADTIRQLCSNITAFEFCKEHGSHISVDYSYVNSKCVPQVHELQRAECFTESKGCDCDKVLNHYESGNEIIYILKCIYSIERYYYRIIKNGDIFEGVKDITMGCKDTNGKYLIGLSDKFPEHDKEDLLSILRNLEPQTRGFLDYRNKMFYEKWSDIPVDSRPEIFIRHEIDTLCQPCFNDIQEIDLENDKVYFEHDHSEVFDK